MSLRPLTQTQSATETHDGEGVSLRRSLGLRPIRWHDPFLLLDEFYSFGTESKAGFPDHPHRGFSTLTYMLKGHMNHADNQGNQGRIGAGGFQWMTAGRGIIHSEAPEPDTDGMRGLQLWVNLPSKLKMRDPFYINGEAGDVPEVSGDSASVKVLAGDYQDQTGPIKDDVTNLVYLDVTLEAGAEIELPLPEGHNFLLYAIDGAITLGGDKNQALASATLGILGDGNALAAKAGEEAVRFVAIGGTPIGEPISRYGPFVMTYKSEIEQAISDYQNGLF